MATPEQLIADARGYASEVAGNAQRALSEAQARIGAVGYIIPNPEEVDVGDIHGPDGLPDAPGVADRSLNLPPAPTAPPEFQDIGELNISTTPRLTARAPTLVMPSRPGQVPRFTAELPPINTDVEFPELPPQLVNPILPEPTIADRPVPIKPDVILPQFNGTVPRLTAEAPTELDRRMEEMYRSMAPGMIATLNGEVDRFIQQINPEFPAQMARIEAQLSKYLAGGTGFNPAVEDAIYERGRDKGTAEYLRTERAAWAGAAARGFTIPDAAALGSSLLARQGLADNQARQATDIVIKQAEIEQANLQFAVTQSVNVRQWIFQGALSYHSNLIQINGQALEYAKTVLGMLIESYNLQLKAYSAQLEGLRAEVAVYEALMKGALSLIDLYKAEIDALQALTQVDVAKVGILRARVDVLQALANVYKTRIDAVVSKAELEKLKLEKFGMQVNVYRAQIDANNAEWGGYKAALDGNGSLVNLYTGQVQAFGVEMSGFRTEVDAKAKVIETRAAANKALLEQHDSALRTYETIVRAQGEVARMHTDVDKTKISAWSAEVQARLGYATANADVYRTRANVAIHNANSRMQAQDLQQKSMLSFQTAVVNLANTNADVYGRMANAALSGMNSVVSKGE